MDINQSKYRIAHPAGLLVAIVIAFFIIPESSAQSNASKTPLRVRKGSWVYMQDSLHYINYDTILYLDNSLIPDSPDDIERTRVFYDSLKARASRSGFARKLYDIAIVLPPDRSNSDSRPSTGYHDTEYEGSSIRNIRILRLDPFGTDLNNPGTSNADGFTGFMNRTHATTREFIIRNYLLFNEGERLNTFSVNESERILRRLKYIDDARIIIIPIADDQVDIMVVTRDVYSLGMGVEIRGAKSGTVELFERSLFGLGHDFVISFPYDYYQDYYGFGYQLSYNIKNINRSLIDATVIYSNALGREYYGLNVEREFLTATTKYAGGFSIRETYTSSDLDTLDRREPVEYNNLDMWMGRSFLVDTISRTRMVVAARYINNNVYERPEISSASYHSLQRYKLYLASIAIVRQSYYKTNLIYNFGRTEDITYGTSLAVTWGKEFNEFNTRNYYGIKAAGARMPAEAGYFYTGAELGLFTRGSITEQGAFDMQLRYISNLTGVGRYRLRYFASAGYTRGFKRFDDEYLRVNESFGIRGFDNDSIRPGQRAVLNFETVAFSPLYLYGFRFVFFGFADAGILNSLRHFNLEKDLVAEIGAGVRLRNENLIFKTIQLRFSFFPFSPPYSTLNRLNVTGEKLLKPPDFDPGAPSVIRYR